MKSKIIPAVIIVLVISLIAFAYLFVGHLKSIQSISTIIYTSTINATPVITYESASGAEVGEWVNLSLPVPFGYTFTNKTLRNYTYCPFTYTYFYNGGASSTGEDGGGSAFILPNGVVPVCSVEWVGDLGDYKANDIANGTLIVQAVGMVEVYNASGVKFTGSSGDSHFNYTINNTYSSWLTIVSLVCHGGPPCSISTPSGCKIVQHAGFQNTNGNIGNRSVTIEACSDQSPGKYNFTLNPSPNETGMLWTVARYHAGIARNVT